MGGSYWQQCSGGIRQDPVITTKADEPNLDGSCCTSCGCFCISWIGLMQAPNGSCSDSGNPGHGTYSVACNPSDYLCIASPIKVYPAVGGACESTATGCHFEESGFNGCGVSSTDFFRFKAAGAGAAGVVPLVPTGGWVLFYSGPGFFGLGITVWVKVAFQPLQVAPGCTGTWNIAGGPNPNPLDKPACCCDGTNYPCNPLTGTKIPAGWNHTTFPYMVHPPGSTNTGPCSGATPCTFVGEVCDDTTVCGPGNCDPTFSFNTDTIFPAPDTTIRCQSADGTLSPTC